MLFMRHPEDLVVQVTDGVVHSQSRYLILLREKWNQAKGRSEQRADKQPSSLPVCHHAAPGRRRMESTIASHKARASSSLAKDWALVL